MSEKKRRQATDLFTLIKDDYSSVDQLFRQMLQTAADIAVQDELYPTLRRDLDHHFAAAKYSLYTQAVVPDDLVAEVSDDSADVYDLLSRLDFLYGRDQQSVGWRERWGSALQELGEAVDRLHEEELEIIDALCLNCSPEQLVETARRFSQARKRGASDLAA